MDLTLPQSTPYHYLLGAHAPVSPLWTVAAGVTDLGPDVLQGRYAAQVVTRGESGAPALRTVAHCDTQADAQYIAARAAADLLQERYPPPSADDGSLWSLEVRAVDYGPEPMDGGMRYGAEVLHDGVPCVPQRCHSGAAARATAVRRALWELRELRSGHRRPL